MLEGKYKAKLEFPGGRVVQNKNPTVGGGVWIFSGTTHYSLYTQHIYLSC